MQSAFRIRPLTVDSALQMSMKLAKGVHGLGTYVGGIGVRYLDHQIIAERGEDDNLHGATLPPLSSECCRQLSQN